MELARPEYHGQHRRRLYNKYTQCYVPDNCKSHLFNRMPGTVAQSQKTFANGFIINENPEQIPLRLETKNL